uniref:C2H2-type domain-containing protein n=1 Tax=Ganoderma boninense TaxID=34458 RepID=A0A5K1K495_9APHY|nr:Uncharacterized protein [Ganoderma boninense]
MPSVRLARNSSAVLDSNLQWLAAEAPQFHTQPTSSYYAPAQDSDEDASGTDDDASGSDSDDDPYHPYNIDEPQRKWVSNGQYVYDVELQDGFHAPEHDHVLVADDAPFVPKVEDKDFSPLLHLDPALNFTSHSSRFLPASSPPPQTVSPLDVSRPLPVVFEPVPAPASRTRTHAARRSPLSRPVPVRSSARAKMVKREPSEEPDAEGDDDFFLESDADSEDDYVDPIAARRKSKKSRRRGASGTTRYRNRLSSSPYPSSARSSSAASCASGSTSTTNSRPGSRNRQVFDEPPPRRGEGWTKTGADAWQCRWCDHVQGNKRAPDMERHILSHFRDQQQTQWVCCGVPVHDADAYGVDAEHGAWVFKGQVMVGGCHESFSRMDALKRHWNNPNVPCNGSTAYSRPEDD